MLPAVQRCTQQGAQQGSSAPSSAPKRLLENLQHCCGHSPTALSSTGNCSRGHSREQRTGTAGGSPQRCSKVAPPPAW